jgi:hypothetical protein
MKIEVELDDQRVFDAVVEKLHQRMWLDLSPKLDQAMKGEIVATLGIEIRKHVRDRLPGYVLSNGQTVLQWMDDLLTKKMPSDWRHRSKLQEIVDNSIHNEAHRMFQEIVKPFVEEFKKGLIKNVVQKAINSLAELPHDG